MQLDRWRTGPLEVVEETSAGEHCLPDAPYNAPADSVIPSDGMQEILVRGQRVRVPAAEIGGATVICKNGWLKVASVHDEEYLDADPVTDPESTVKALRASHLKADIFTFTQRMPDLIPRYRYHLEWDNMAAIPITSYRSWLENSVTYDVRKAVKRARRMGVDVRKTAFDDALVRGICKIYNETPIRQGKAFWHYRKEFARVKEELSTHPDRSCFIGAYFEGELIGFIRMIFVNGLATSTQVLTQISHRQQKTSNALIAKAVEICEQEGLSHFVYGRYIYNDADSSLTEFKRRNGFQSILVPRYYVPLTLKGAIALKLRLHWPLPQRIPQRLRPPLYRLRGWLAAQRA